jgi:hypothetical protein
MITITFRMSQGISWLRIDVGATKNFYQSMCTTFTSLKQKNDRPRCNTLSVLLPRPELKGSITQRGSQTQTNHTQPPYDEIGFTHAWSPIRLGYLAILLLQRAPEAIEAEQREEYE